MVFLNFKVGNTSCLFYILCSLSLERVLTTEFYCNRRIPVAHGSYRDLDYFVKHNPRIVVGLYEPPRRPQRCRRGAREARAIRTRD